MKETKVVRETEVRTDDTSGRETEVNEPIERNEHERNVAQRIIWYIFGVLIALLLLRFMFALLGANRSNGIADFIYSVTAPLVSPFTNLFSFSGIQYGVSTFEAFTLVAIVFYTLIGYGIAKLLDINRR